MASFKLSWTGHTLIKTRIVVHSLYTFNANYLFFHPMIEIAILAILNYSSTAITRHRYVIIIIASTAWPTVELYLILNWLILIFWWRCIIRITILRLIPFVILITSFTPLNSIRALQTLFARYREITLLISTVSTV